MNNGDPEIVSPEILDNILHWLQQVKGNNGYPTSPSSENWYLPLWCVPTNCMFLIIKRIIICMHILAQRTAMNPADIVHGTIVTSDGSEKPKLRSTRRQRLWGKQYGMHTLAFTHSIYKNGSRLFQMRY
jgi:hypothetical protein